MSMLQNQNIKFKTLEDMIGRRSLLYTVVWRTEKLAQYPRRMDRSTVFCGYGVVAGAHLTSNQEACVGWIPTTRTKRTITAQFTKSFVSHLNKSSSQMV